MSLKTRRILYFLFISLFSVITPLLILYSLGYNLQSGFKFQKSGIIIVETEPKGAIVNLGEKNIGNIWSKILGFNKSQLKTPVKIKNLLPGEYDISVELDGYWPWRKKLSVLPGQTTFATNIYLFRNDQPTLLSKLSDVATEFSPNNEYLVNFGTSTAQLINLDNEKEETQPLSFSTSSIQEIKKKMAWSENQKYLIFDSKVFSIENWSNILDLRQIINEQITEHAWNGSSNLIYKLKEKVFSLNTNNSSIQDTQISGNIQSITAKNGSIYFINQSDNDFELLELQKLESQPNKILKIPSSKYEFLNLENNFLNLRDSDNKILYIIDVNSDLKPLKKTIYNCENIKWISDSKLLYSTGFEAWLLDLNTNQEILLTRISERINNVEWHPSNNYILYSTQKNIYILELDNREKNNITKIAEFNEIKKISLSKNGEILYIIENDIGSHKLYKLFIQ